MKAPKRRIKIDTTKILAGMQQGNIDDLHTFIAHKSLFLDGDEILKSVNRFLRADTVQLFDPAMAIAVAKALFNRHSKKLEKPIGHEWDDVGLNSVSFANAAVTAQLLSFPVKLAMRTNNPKVAEAMLIQLGKFHDQLPKSIELPRAITVSRWFKLAKSLRQKRHLREEVTPMPPALADLLRRAGPGLIRDRKIPKP